MNVDELRAKIRRDLRAYPNWDKRKQTGYASMMYAMFHSDEPSEELNTLIREELPAAVSEYKQKDHAVAHRILAVLEEVVFRRNVDVKAEIQDHAKSTVDFAREFKAALERGKQRDLAERLRKTRHPKIRKRMGDAIEYLKKQVHDDIDERRLDWELEEKTREEQERQRQRDTRPQVPKADPARQTAKQESQDAQDAYAEKKRKEREDQVFEKPRKAQTTLEELDEALNMLEDVPLEETPIELPEIEDTVTEETIIEDIGPDPLERGEPDLDGPMEDSEDENDQSRRDLFKKLYSGQD